MTPGGTATRNGRRLEEHVEQVLRSAGWAFKRQVVIGVSIYGHPLKVDVDVDPRAGFPGGLVIECKWQQSAGSADEKFPYVVENIRSGQFGSRRVVVVIASTGFKAGAVRWLRLQQLAEPRLAGVFNLEEFMAWVARQ